MLVHPQDASSRGLESGDVAEVSTRTGTLEIVVEVTDTIMQGVVSIPHGWGHNLASTKLEIANQHAGTNANALRDERLFDAPSIHPVLNGVPVRLRLGSVRTQTGSTA